MDIQYPRTILRIKAALIDVVLILILLMALSYVFDNIEEVANWIKILIYVLVFYFYEPFWVGFYGGTLGHKIMGIEVRMMNDRNKRIGFPISMLRFMIKATLGWISFLISYSREDSRCIHDLACGTGVFYKRDLEPENKAVGALVNS